MSGNIAGGKAAAITNMQKYGADFYKRIGRLGGKKGTTGGFYYMKQIGQLDKIRAAGSKGGSLSRKTRKPTDEDL